MTVLGEKCMDKSDRPAAREDNREPAACQGGLEGELGRLPYESLERQLSEDQDQADSVKAADHDDELPLGSEANNLRQCGQESGSRSGGEPFQDKRLLWLRQNGGHIPNSGWTSFNSELSNLTSGSSANSVEWLLQERQADPEQVLLNLGFGSGLSQSASMFTRIPERFLQAQNAPLRDDVPQEGNEAAVQQNSSRGQFYFTDVCNSVCDSEYYTYILNRVPAYYFKESCSSDHSSDSDSFVCPDSSSAPITPAWQDWQSTKMCVQNVKSVPEALVPQAVCLGDVSSEIQLGKRFSAEDEVYHVQCIAHSSPYTDSGCVSSGQWATQQSFSLEEDPPDPDEFSVSSGSTATQDDADYGFLTLAPNESLV